MLPLTLCHYTYKIWDWEAEIFRTIDRDKALIQTTLNKWCSSISPTYSRMGFEYHYGDHMWGYLERT